MIINGLKDIVGSVRSERFSGGLKKPTHTEKLLEIACLQSFPPIIIITIYMLENFLCLCIYMIRIIWVLGPLMWPSLSTFLPLT